MNDILKPCPFCGREPKFVLLADMKHAIVRCVNLDCNEVSQKGLKDEVAEKWNKRVPLTNEPTQKGTNIMNNQNPPFPRCYADDIFKILADTIDGYEKMSESDNSIALVPSLFTVKANEVSNILSWFQDYYDDNKEDN